ncbi:MAG: DpnD/PcfM family protein [Paludibacteraceae bacterium]|nr:DpnD/PcfM family protein [Paludibacteraceae bacterium]
MENYKIEITETLSKTITVRANTSSDAELKVQKKYYNGKIVLDADDFVCVDFRTI